MNAYSVFVIFAFVLTLLVVGSAYAQDPVRFGDCLATLNVPAEVRVWTSSDGQQFRLRPLEPGEYEALADMPVTDIWRGYDQPTRWDWPGSDYPGWWAVAIIYQWRKVQSVNFPGEDITLWIVWSDHDPENLYLFPLRPNHHGLSHGCTLYRAPLDDVLGAMGDYITLPSDWQRMPN